MARPIQLAQPVIADFSRRVRAKRRAAKMTQRQLADRAFLKRLFISRIERGEANPSLVSITLIAIALGCTVVEMFEPERPS